MCVNNLYEIFPFYNSHLQEMYSLKKNSKTLFFETFVNMFYCMTRASFIRLKIEA